MKRMIILIACVALLLSGCRSCPWFKRRGAPCRSSLTFDPYTTAPAPLAPACGIDGFAGEIGCGQDTVVGYGGIPDCPNCQVTGDVGVGGVDYYGGMETAPVVPFQTTPQPATEPPAAP
ncbi:MAG: hypothetical protein KDB14_33900 [Planctomycetales bacterium]|nr:hypothetical protein [Planctomycetales bacterium]